MWSSRRRASATAKDVSNGKISEYRVTMEVTFLLEG
jgi:flavin-binding protein dodecin